MKKYLIFGSLVLLFCLASCMKERNCDCAGMMSGKFVVLDEPYRTTYPYWKEGLKITAHFIDSTGQVLPIHGQIPKSFPVGDTVDVNICLKYNYYRPGRIHTEDRFGTFTINCIERL